MKHKKLIRVALFLTSLCVFLSSCSSLFRMPTLTLDDFEPSSPSESRDIDTTDTVLLTDETTAVYIDSESVSVSDPETVETESDEQEEIPFEKGKYASLDGYNSLLTFDNGEDMQLLYRRLKALADEIHDSEDIDAYSLDTSDTVTVANIIGSVPYPPSISQEELFLVFNMFRCDNPIYYWINNQIIFSSKFLYMMTVDDYADGSARKSYNAIIEAKIDLHLEVIKEETNTYRKALYFHDAIIEDMDYASDEQGGILDGLKYHNIYGAFVGKSGVCEAYAKAFQLLLNAVGIENCYVIGKSGTILASGVGHVWNMIRLDDGKWYYCDLTWDDLGDEEDGVQHNNFCVGSNTNISWKDDGYLYTPTTFASQHIENLPTGTGEEFQYALPSASDEAYDDGSPDMLRTILDTLSFTCMISGYDDMVILQVKKAGEVELPFISYNGHAYHLTSIIDASLMYDGLGEIEDYTTFSNPQTTVLYISGSVKYVSNKIFEASRIPEIIIDESNPYIYYDTISGTIKKK